MSVVVTKDVSAAIIRAIEDMAQKQVLIGVPADRAPRKGKEKGPINNAALAWIHNNGSPKRGIPARPYLVPGVREAGPKCASVLKSYAKVALTHPGAIDKGLHAAGLIAVSSVKKRIVNQVGFVKLKAATIAARKRKGFEGEKALIRTGQLLNSTTFVVRSKK